MFTRLRPARRPLAVWVSARALTTLNVALFAVLTAASAQLALTLPWTPVPVTGQVAAVLVSGVVLGARVGAASQIAYLALGLAGAPAFAWSPILSQGALRLLGPTGGFLLAFPLAAWIAGRVSHAEEGHDIRRAVVSMACGLAALYVVGAVWLAWWSALDPLDALRGIVGNFLAADLLKIAASAALVRPARAALAYLR